MFDYLPQGTEAPDRQGCTVFREHWWFDNLPAGVPANQNEAEALRQFLYTYVHEIGHAFNLLHSWQKGFANPPADGDEDDLSWMNYPSRYDGLPGNNPGAFWNAFPLQFEDPELLHLRHGDRPTVIFGGEPFGQGAALGVPVQLVKTKSL